MSKEALMGFFVLALFFCIVTISYLLSVQKSNDDIIKQQHLTIQNIEQEKESIVDTLSTVRDSLDNSLSRDVLWLTRAIYSETDRPLEMYYVAHVIKNRVETCYRGQCTYKDVILDPYQFSAFNNNNQYYRNVNKSNARRLGPWIAAKQVALDVYMEDIDPTQGSTHFFSQVSMVDNSFPHWAYSGEQIIVNNTIEEERFRFYKNVR